MVEAEAPRALDARGPVGFVLCHQRGGINRRQLDNGRCLQPGAVGQQADRPAAEGDLAKAGQRSRRGDGDGEEEA